MVWLNGTLKAKWFNPVTGEYTIIDTYPNFGSHTFTSPGDNGTGKKDWVLILESMEK